MITLIVARDRNGAIGKDNDIPWRVREDLAFFQRETSGGAVIMGRNTWDSLPFKPLKNRLNIVVSRQEGIAEHRVESIEAAIALAEAEGYRRIYGMGGERIYAALLPLADRLLVTEVELEVEGADTHFPEFQDADWRRVGTYEIRAEGPRCVAHEYLRR
ncbi:dihydrofolate reductase [Pelagimonas sp. KU-00592-HH]|uniref:dihydrofolate reductase n=1 Tax=Pelagimonas sp. KU-00592-HH TaxID=3127651 RepID=UPI00310AA19F